MERCICGHLLKDHKGCAAHTECCIYCSHRECVQFVDEEEAEEVLPDRY